jgi:predicted porin
LAVSIENPAGTIRTAGAASKDDLNYEVALNYTGIENLNFNVGYFKDNQDNAALETDAVNVNATYQVGKALLGAEYTELSTDALDRDAMLLLVDYDVSDKLGVAVRYSTYEAAANVDVDKITIAPNYAITESLGAILEYSDISHDAANSDSDEIALELNYTF